MNGIQKSLLLWGVICVVGFGAFQFWQTSIGNMQLTLLLLVVIGLIALQKWVPNTSQKPMVQLWAALVIIGLIVTFLWGMNSIPLIGLKAPLISTWLILFGIGFVATGHYTKEHAWYVAAALQLVVLGGIYGNIALIQNFANVWLGLATGVPLILMSFKY